MFNGPKSHWRYSIFFFFDKQKGSSSQSITWKISARTWVTAAGALPDNLRVLAPVRRFFNVTGIKLAYFHITWKASYIPDTLAVQNISNGDCLRARCYQEEVTRCTECKTLATLGTTTLYGLPRPAQAQWIWGEEGAEGGEEGRHTYSGEEVCKGGGNWGGGDYYNYTVEMRRERRKEIWYLEWKEGIRPIEGN